MKLVDKDFNNIIENNDIVLVDFWAPWCSPCRMIAPTIEELETEYADKAIIAKLNTDENQEIAAQNKVRSIPTIILFQNGKEVDRIVGVQSKLYLSEKLDKLLGD